MTGGGIGNASDGRTTLWVLVFKSVPGEIERERKWWKLGERREKIKKTMRGRVEQTFLNGI